jgi:hypothetical protein
LIVLLSRTSVTRKAAYTNRKRDGICYVAKRVSAERLARIRSCQRSSAPDDAGGLADLVEAEAVEMPNGGKPGKPKSGFPPFPPFLEIA